MGKGRLQGNCELTISECMYLHYKEKYGKLPSFHIDRMSKDSVGDAVYSREAIKQLPDASNIIVITSDWHVKRLSIIFERVYGALFKKVSIIGTKEIDSLSTERLSDINKSEAASIGCFLSTFPEEDSDSDWSSLIKSRHPLYLER